MDTTANLPSGPFPAVTGASSGISPAPVLAEQHRKMAESGSA